MVNIFHSRHMETITYKIRKENEHIVLAVTRLCGGRPLMWKWNQAVTGRWRIDRESISLRRPIELVYTWPDPILSGSRVLLRWLSMEVQTIRSVYRLFQNDDADHNFFEGEKYYRYRISSKIILLTNIPH